MNESLKSAICDCLNKLDSKQLEDLLRQAKQLAGVDNLAHRTWKQAALKEIRRALQKDKGKMLNVA